MIDEKRIADFFAELVSIDSPSLEECEMADTLKAKFAEIGVNFTEDHTQEQTGSNAGNLFARIPGSIDGAPVLFAAHMDTVEPAKGKKAVFHDDGTVTSDGTTVLQRCECLRLQPGAGKRSVRSGPERSNRRGSLCSSDPCIF